MDDISKYSKDELIEIINNLTQEKQITDKAINNQLDTFFVFDPDTGNAIKWNKAFKDVSGYTDEEISKLKAPHSYYSEEDVLKATKFLDQLNEKKFGSIELELICKNGQKILTEYAVSFITDEKGRNEYIVSIGRDITKRHELEKAVKNNEAFLKTIMDNLPIGIAVNSVDPTVDFSYANDNFAKFYRTTKKALMHPDSFWEAVYEDPEFRKEIKKRVLDDILSGDPKRFYWNDVPIERKGKPLKYITAMNIPVPNNTLMISTVWDVTDRKLAELELKQQNEEYQSLNEEYQSQNDDLLNAKEISEQNVKYFRELVEKMPLAISIYDGHKNVEYINKKFTQLLGYNIEDIPTIANWWVNAYPDEVYREEVKKTWEYAVSESFKKNKEITPQVWTVTTKNRKKRICEFHMMPIGNKAVVVINDLTEERKKQGELIESRKKAEESDRLKSAFLANMSHEIRTPMNGILGFAELLKTSELSQSKKDLYIDVIEKSGKRMLNTINDLMDISKIESGQMEVNKTKTNLNDLLTSLYDFFAREARQKNLQLTLHKSLSSSDSIVSTDKDKLFAVLTNLIKNAIKFTDQGKIDFGYSLKSEKLEFFVKDTGIGIAEENHDKIFNRFVQAESTISRKYEGSGLGLPISKAFIQLLGGEMWINSAKGKGSTFYFTVPYSQAPRFEDKTANETDNIKLSSAILKNLSVLIVDDEEYSRGYLFELLHEKCKKVTNAENGMMAIEHMRKNSNDTDLILMDIKMPEMDGYEATHKIREFNNEVTIIAQTAYAFADDHKKAIESGCNGYLSKPINVMELNKTIIKHFDKKQ